MRCLLPAPEKHLFFGGRWPYAAGEYDVDSKAVRALSEVFLMSEYKQRMSISTRALNKVDVLTLRSVTVNAEVFNSG
jgi:hypothetical protein